MATWTFYKPGVLSTYWTLCVWGRVLLNEWWFRTFVCAYRLNWTSIASWGGQPAPITYVVHSWLWSKMYWAQIPGESHAHRGCAYNLIHVQCSKLFNGIECAVLDTYGQILYWCTINPFTAKLINLNLHPLEVVSRWRDPQLQVSENYSDLTKWRSTLFKSCWLMSHFLVNMFWKWYSM